MLVRNSNEQIRTRGACQLFAEGYEQRGCGSPCRERVNKEEIPWQWSLVRDPKFWLCNEMHCTERDEERQMDREREREKHTGWKRLSARLGTRLGRIFGGKKDFPCPAGHVRGGRRKFRIRVYRGWIRVRASRRGTGDATGTYRIHQYKQTTGRICGNDESEFGFPDHLVLFAVVLRRL